MLVSTTDHVDKINTNIFQTVFPSNSLKIKFRNGKNCKKANSKVFLFRSFAKHDLCEPSSTNEFSMFRKKMLRNTALHNLTLTVSNWFFPNFGELLKTHLAAKFKKVSELGVEVRWLPRRAWVRLPPAGLGRGMLNRVGNFVLSKVYFSFKNTYWYNVPIFSQGPSSVVPFGLTWNDFNNKIMS